MNIPIELQLITDDSSSTHLKLRNGDFMYVRKTFFFYFG